ncbi:helix-turn-helix transcriptional regulator [Azospirillum doebereinerae]
MMDIPTGLTALIDVAAEMRGAILIYRDDMVVFANQEAKRIYACQDWANPVSFDQCFRKAIELGRIDDRTILDDPAGHLAYAKMARARERGFRFRRLYDGQVYDRHHTGLSSEWNAQIWVKARPANAGPGIPDPAAPGLLEQLEQNRALARMTSLLEQMGVAMAVVDADGRMIDGSPLMADRLDEGAPLGRDGLGFLSCQDRACTIRLRRAIGAVALGWEAAALVPVLVDGTPHPIAVMSAPQADGTAIVVINETARAESLGGILMTAYGLTNREADVVVRLGGGETADEIATALDRKLDTVRRQIATAKAKIAAGRQHNLAHIVTRAAALFGGISPPSSRKGKQ